MAAMEEMEFERFLQPLREALEGKLCPLTENNFFFLVLASILNFDKALAYFTF